ncbi:MAG: hypothetical protein WBD55_12255 [Dehalococcoidia bacterium]
MVAVYGDIETKDDYTHPLGPEENFNESMYYNFFHREDGRGGFMRIGNRANEGYAEVTLCLYLPTGEVLFNYQRPHIDGNDEMSAAGMRFEVIEPFAKHHTTYNEGAVFLTQPEQMAEPGPAFRENPHKRVRLDITHEALGPVYGSAGSQRETADPEKEFARAHYEQHMRTYGTMEIDGETFQIDGAGLRDHSWGPRYWQAIHSYRWLNVSFGSEFMITVSEVSPAPGVRNQNGVVIRDGTIERIVAVDIDTETASGKPYQRRMTAKVGLDSGEKLVLEGDVRGFIPLRNRRAGMQTYIGEGLTEYRCAGHTAFGISEYLDQVQ